MAFQKLYRFNSIYQFYISKTFQPETNEINFKDALGTQNFLQHA